MVFDLPINNTVKLNDATYKNPARLRVGTFHNLSLDGWNIYFVIEDQLFRVGEFDSSAWPGGGFVFSYNPNQVEQGVDKRLSDISQLFSFEEIISADRFGLVASNGTERSQLFWYHNNVNVYGERPGKLPRGHGNNTENSKFLEAVDYPPGYEPPEPPPTDPHCEEKLKTIASYLRLQAKEFLDIADSID